MSLLNVLALPVVLILDDVNVAFEFLVEATKATLLECDEVIDVDVDMFDEGTTDDEFDNSLMVELMQQLENDAPLFTDNPSR